MLKILWIIISLFLITLIFLRVPKDTAGLSSFATKSTLLGSPSSSEQFLNYLIGLGVICYLFLTFNLN